MNSNVIIRCNRWKSIGKKQQLHKPIQLALNRHKLYQYQAFIINNNNYYYYYLLKDCLD